MTSSRLAHNRLVAAMLSVLIVCASACCCRAGASANGLELRGVDATRNVSAYVAGGGDIGIRRVHVRVEVRDYVGGFTPLAGGGHGNMRNDVVVMAGLRFSK